MAPGNNDTASLRSKSKLSLLLDYRLIIVVLLAAIAVMLLIWKPWHQATKASDRTVNVVGQATVKAEPDEFTFYPTYMSTNPNRDTAYTEISTRSNDIASKLKALGVSAVTSSVNSYDKQGFSPESSNSNITYTLQITAIVSSRDLAQKVQDYLITTTPSGSVTPQPTFSDGKRKQLESQARDAATKDARVKADQSAKNLGFKVGSVKTVEDGTGFDRGYPLKNTTAQVDDSAAGAPAPPKLTVQPGENDITYSVNVTYFVK